MLDATKAAIRAVLKTDATIPESEQSAWTRLLAKGSPVSASSCAPDSLPRLVPIKEVQQLTGLTVQAIRRYARKGALERVLPPDAKRAIGYTEASVRAFLEGRTAK